MKTEDIIIGDRVLVQSGRATTEHAQIKGVNKENGKLIVRLSDGRILEMDSQYILKSFGQ